MTKIRLLEADNVDILLQDSPVAPRGHKIANRRIGPGEAIVKYGQVIGVATCEILSKEHVHVHNCGFQKDSARRIASETGQEQRPGQSQSFLGYARPDGRVGTRNYVGVISTVNCSATVVAETARLANERLLPRFESIDGFVPITHGLGCGMAGPDSDAFEVLSRTIAGYAAHPNFGAVLLVGLGCEVNQLSTYAHSLGPLSRTLTIQEIGGTRVAINHALELLEELSVAASAYKRTPCPISDLVVGLQCGASDGFSALTCNPALGVASDILVASGATCLLSETPEIFGAEHLLKARSSEKVGQKLDDLIAWWANYAARSGASLDNNPSPGNKLGGLTTILEKSLGAVAKAGQSPLSDVICYAEKPTRRGLIFMDSPGYDPVSATGQMASGANLIAFTTGRGSCYGSKPAPTVKLASTSELYTAMRDDMDIDCGTILSGEKSLHELGEEIVDYLIAVASGTASASERNGLGAFEFAPWHIGAVL